MAFIKARWSVDELANVMTQFDVQRVWRAEDDAGAGPWVEITDVASRVPFVADQEAYYYDDSTGDPAFWYDVSFYNSTTFEDSGRSGHPVRGEGMGHYISIQDLRNEGLPTTVTDSRALTLIQRAEVEVENFTRNFFREVSGTFIFDGNNTHLLHLPLPIIEVTSLTVNEMDTELDTDYYRVFNGRQRPNDDRKNPKIVLKKVDNSTSIFVFGDVDKFLKGLDQTVVGSFGFLEPNDSVPIPVKEAVMGLALLGADSTIYERLLGLDNTTGPKISEKTDNHEIQWADLSKKQGRVSMPLWIQNKLAPYIAPRKMGTPIVRYGIIQ